MRPTSGKSIHGSETIFTNECSNAVSVIANDNIYFEGYNLVASDIKRSK